MSHLFQYVDCQILYYCVTSLEKIHFLKCCIFTESHQILVTQVLIFGSSPHCVGKCQRQNFMQCILLEPGKVYGKNKSLNCRLISNSVILIHSICSVRYYADLALIVSVLMVGEADGQDIFFQKRLVSIFFCLITCFGVYHFEYKHLISWY